MTEAFAAVARAIGVKGLIGILVAATLGTMLILQLHKTHVAQKQAAHWQLMYDGEKEAFDLSVQKYREAAAQRAAADKANAERVAAAQRAINERTSSEYEARIAAARARADSLRPHPEAAAHPGSSAAAGVSHVSAAPSGPFGPSTETGLPPGDALVATEQAIQLDELIKWINQNLTINFGNSSPSAPTANH